MSGSRRPRRPRSRAEARERSRAALLTAGAALFARHGLDRPSLDAICRRAGYTRGAFYLHFHDRDDFLVAVMDRVGQEFLDGVLADAAGAPDLAAAAARFVAAVARGDYPLMKRGGVRPHQLLQACARSPAIRARYVALVTDAIARVAASARAGQAAAIVRADLDPTALATLALALVIGAQTMMELEVELDPARLGALLLRLVAPPA